MNPGCDSLKKRRAAARLAAIYADQASVPNEVCHFNILSINRVHEVSGHFLASVLDKNDEHSIISGESHMVCHHVVTLRQRQPVLAFSHATWNNERG